MISSLVQIGNSKGIRIPKKIIDLLQIQEEVALEIENKRLVIKPVSSSIRENWDDMFKAESYDENISFVASEWDNSEWKW